MKKLCIVLGDQLSLSLSSLKAINRETDLVVMAEVWNETLYVKHHKKKLVFILSAMRHFHQELKKSGYQVVYHKLDEKLKFSSFTEVIEYHIKKIKVEKIVVTHPGEYRVLQELKSCGKQLESNIDILPDDRFISEQSTFNTWAKNRKQLRMEYFYRELRKRHDVLMEEGKPVGGKWNYDAENRKPAKTGLEILGPTEIATDSVTNEVARLVEDNFSSHFGDIVPFNYAVTRKQALIVLNEFIEQRLVNFGTYQDAMIEDNAWMFHAHISLYLNAGLLLPGECVRLVEEAYYNNKAPLNAVEGFIRQILGWREYIHGFYWFVMPDYAEQNYFNAARKLPEFYWTGKTKMNCLRQCIKETKENAYAHHIQRLMVLGNFALLADISPQDVNNWFMVVYADAYEWVELPNVTGMALFADGGMLASKPYASGGNYINKMSNYCQNCHYDVKQKTGEQACPFNYMYWGFLARHQKLLSGNHRLSMIYNVWNKMTAEKKQAILESAQQFLNSNEIQ